MRRGETSADQTSQPTMFVSPLVGSTSTGLSVPPVAVIGDLGKTTFRGCAFRTHKRVPVASGRCFRSPTSRTAPHDSMIWRTSQAGTARPCDGWRDHFSSVVVPSTHDDFSSEFHGSMTLRFFELTSDQHSSGVFDAPFSESELSRALSKCHDSAPGLDGLRYSTFQQHLPWWRAMLLGFFNLLLSWNVVPSVWKLSQVVPVFKDGDPADPDRYRPISLASCAFKVFERLIHGRIAPHICNRLDDSQGGFRWGADACVYGLVDALRLRQDTHTFCAFVDIRKAFDTSWVEATLVRLHQSGVTGGMWRTIANFLCGTLSQVRVRGDVSPPWVDTGIAQGRVLSPLLFNLLVKSLAAAIRRASPGVRLVPSSDFRLTDQLYADDLLLCLVKAKLTCSLPLTRSPAGEDSGASHLVSVLRNRR